MDMRKSGLPSSLFLKILFGCITSVILLALFLVGAWILGSVPSHMLEMHRLERAFADMPHPIGTTLIRSYTYFGEATTAGNTSNGCYYYTVEVRLLKGSLDEMVKYYERASEHVSSAIVGSKVAVLSVTKESRALLSDDFFLSAVMEETFLLGYDSAYLVYAKKVTPDMSGDFRCWD